MFEFFRNRRKKKYREQYRKLTEDEKTAYCNLMDHDSVYGSNHIDLQEMIERCEAAREVDEEEAS